MKKRNLIIVGMILIVMLFITGVSYALWQITLQQTDKNVITTGCFKIEYSDVNPINLEKAYPITDEEGKSLVPYEFTITNTCDSKASFQINLETLNTTTLSDLSVMKMVLNELEKEATSKFLTSHEVVSKTLENAKTSYKLKTGFLKAKESKTFNLRLWLDENTPTEEAYMNKIFESKVTVITSYIVDETPPEVIASTSKNELNSITVDASDSFDEISGIETYSFRLDEEEWNTQEEPVYTFSDLEYKEYNIEIQASDFLENKSEVKTLKEVPKVRATEYVNSLNGNGEVLKDETVDNNVRYIGKDPDNYVYFNCDDPKNPTLETCELWRIIGSMNNIDNGTRTKETRIKLIRNESIGEFSWDTSDSNINDGYGVNEWSESDAMKLLNPGYDRESVGGSLYWNRGNGSCYNGQNNVTTSCDFSTSGLKETAKSMIELVAWNTGNNGNVINYNNILTSKFYELERSSNTGKICSSGIYCNDTVNRTTLWVGYTGLIYPSDYGYATSGGPSTNRETCLNTVLYSWNDSTISECKNNNWLYKPSANQWGITAVSHSSYADGAFNVTSAGVVDDASVSIECSMFPTLYLKSNINIVSGTGELNNPFVVSLN